MVITCADNLTTLAETVRPLNNDVALELLEKKLPELKQVQTADSVNDCG